MKKSILKFGALAATAIALNASLTSCNGGGAGNGSDSTSSASEAVVGAGSSFDQPLFSKMFAAYYDSTKTQINYQSVGSGAGISQLTGKTVDFGASDAPMTGKQDSTAGATVIHIPITAGAVVVSYNLPDVKDTLKFTPEVLANIYLGKITKWNDPAIAAANPGVKLPSTAILVAHRSDGSGTSAIFTSFLDKVSPEWHSKVGTSTSVNWPAGVGGKGNEGVSGIVKQTPGGIGYIELAYAIQNNIAYGKVQNKSGNFIVPTPESVTAAANITIPADGKVWITNTDAPDGYPISGFSWVLLYQEQGYGSRTQAQAEQLVNLVNWMVHSGQQYGASLYYAPLSSAAVSVDEALLKSITYKGQAILK
ncbi:phosphate ABC transporter substrate-binding protein PstS [Arachidicoccus ginsenosidimutans]|uniref:phosphate ABC transporter substrate-binding protein PstS n=1 Tax=Arachidicoccus sp. BS20 TaxID=1850526 RepID=UPI0007F17A34|nr:phosphate ABC transporter substrate-binding protein PstS [Arachidicoccus sp. BS20]ANI90273.1 phosphate ABC transporter substrate-binding protein PstS [Arachidicoccus sp. BS20]